MSKVKIIARIRPFLPTEVADDSVTSDGVAISLKDSRNASQRLIYNEFAACYDYASNDTEEIKDLFKAEIEPALDIVYGGKTLAILCYGVTSSGKTTTMQGNEQVPGIVARSIEKVLQGPSNVSGPTTEQYQYKMQFFEIYCDECYDLLAPEDMTKKLAIRETKDGRVIVEKLSTTIFSTMDEFQILMKKANRSRKTAATASNRSSSRSHAILSVTVFRVPPRRLSLTHLPQILGRVEFVDLAGSERNTSSTSIVGPAPKTRMAESISINKSLTALSRVVTALNNGSSVVPYRDSPLTRLLKDALGGKSITLLICNMAPGSKWLSHTRATIEFATKAKMIKSVQKTIDKEESKKRVEQKRHVDPEFNLAVEAEVARRLAAMTAPMPPPPALQVQPSPPPSLIPDAPSVPDEIPLSAPIAAIPTSERPQDAAYEVNDNVQDYYDAEVPVLFDEVPEPPEPVEDSAEPEVNQEKPTITGEANTNTEQASTKRITRSKDKRQPKKAVTEPSASSSAKSSFNTSRNDSRGQDADEAKERYRRKLTKGLKQKHEEYSNSGLPVDRRNYAKACIIAGKMALDDRDDVELAISMFEKAISWYPENERLLEETLKLKKRLREEQGDTASSGLLSLSSDKTPAKRSTRKNPLASIRNGNSKEDKGKRREMFHFDVAKEEASQSKPDEYEEPPKKKKAPKKGTTKPKGKGRAVLAAAAAAFADSDDEGVAEDVSEDSEAEVEKSLQMARLELVPDPSPVKRNKRRERKRKSGDSDEDYARHDRKEHGTSKDSPPKRRRIIF